MAYQEQYMDDLAFPVEVLLRDTRHEDIAVQPHWHESFEFQYMLEGRSLQVLNGQAFDAGPQDLVIIRNGDIHATYCPPGQFARILVVKFLPAIIYGARQNSDELKLQAIFNRSSQNATVMLSGNQPYKPEIDRLLFQIADEYQNQLEAFETAIRGDLLLLIAWLQRSAILTVAPALLDRQHSSQFRELLAVINNRLRTGISLDEAARIMHMNPSYFSRFFKKATGRGFKYYLDCVRLTEAERLIVNERQTLTQAAMSCGFSSPAAFSRTFRRIRGQAPGYLLHRHI